MRVALVRGGGAFALTASLFCGWVVAPVRAQSVRLATDIRGLSGDLLSNARLALTTSRIASEDLSPLQARRAFARGAEEIALALQPFGYYQPRVESRLEDQGSSWTAHFSVDPGPVVVLDSVRVAITGPGASDTMLAGAVDSFPLAPGDTLQHAPYDLFKLRTHSQALEAGYLDAKWSTHAISVNRETSRAGIDLSFETGPLYHFGPTTLDQGWVDERLLIGLMPYKQGDPFRFSKLLALQNTLSASPYFSSIEVRPRKDSTGSVEVPVDVTLVPARPRRFEFGAGYGTDTGIRGKARVEFRRLNHAGHFGEIDIQASEVESSLGVQYKIPTFYPRSMLFTIYGGFGRLTPDWAESWRATAGVSMSRLHWGWREVIALAYEHEDFTVADVDGVTNLLIPSIAFNRTWSRGGSTPRSGTRFRVEARGAGLLSSETFGTLLGEARRIQPLTARSRLLMRVEAARTFTKDVTRLPPSHRFVTGGDQSIRGFAFESLGPRNADSALVGGDALLVASVEADMTVWRTFGVAAFFDLGNAYGEGFTGGGGIEHGTGVGLRWRSPIGPLRFDFAFATSQPGTPFRIHFSIGPDL